jgi:glycosyltransferase involved in cell wall biosynthesis
MEPQPILILARPADGGIRSHIIHLIEHLDRSRFSVGLAAPSKLIGSLPDNLPPFSSFDLPIRATTGPLDFVAAAQLAQFVRAGNCLVHAHGVRAGFVASMARVMKRFPMVVTYHNLPQDGQLSALALKTIARRSDASIAVSRAIARAIPSAGCRVIPNGIDLYRFRNGDREAARSELDIHPAQTAVVCVARLSPDKGVDVLIRAARLLPQIAVIIAGSGEERNRLESSAPSNVRFLGYVADTATIFAAADIVVIPSRREGQGIVALEAMASGKAIIASNIGGLPEMIEHNVTGLLTPPEDATAIAAAVLRLADDKKLRARLALAGKKWVLANGDVRLRAKEIEAVYDSVISIERNEQRNPLQPRD